jgi:hypothetical protein
MAEIAAVFHWPLHELERLDLNELIEWRDRAVRCWNRMHGDGKEE